MALFVLGCASSTTPPIENGSGRVQALGQVSVERDGADSVILLEGITDPVYTVTSREDDLMVIDLVGVVTSGGRGPGDPSNDGDRQLAAYDGVVDLVTLSTFGEHEDLPLTRVEIMMAGPGSPEVSSTLDGLEIRIVPESEASVARALEASDRLGTTEPAPSDGSSDSTLSWAEEPVVVQPAPPATRLTGIVVEEETDGVLLGLEADGAIGSLEVFTLENPARLVIDLPGIEGSELPGLTKVGASQVESVRVGGHGDKVRIVVDGGPEASGFEGRHIMPGATGLWVSIGGGEAVSQSMEQALTASASAWAQTGISGATIGEQIVSEDDVVLAGDEPSMAAIAPESAMEEESAAVPAAADPTPTLTATDPMNEELAQVYGLHYERTEGLDRVAILADSTLAYEAVSPDAETLVLRIPGAAISEEASDRIFPKPGGPVSLIHAFQQPEVAMPEVRVVFTRAPNLEPSVVRRGSMLFVEFRDIGVAAAAPPAFSQQDAGGGAPAAMAAGSAGSSTAEQATARSEARGQSMEMPESMVGSASADGIESASTLPSFDTAGGIEGSASLTPTAHSPEAAIASSPFPSAAPAAVEVPAAIEVLEEGGLIDGKEYRGRRVSLDFKDVAIADVLRLIAEVSDLNVIAGDEVAGNVTIRLVEVPWDQALDVILMTKGLGFVRVGNVLRIAPMEILKAEEEVRLTERRNKEKLEDLEVKLLPVNYADGKDIEGLVKRVLSARGTVNLDKRTNTLIIKDISSVIDEASALVAAIDTQTPQVMIEAKIVEANLDFSRELGSVWGVQTQQFQDPFNGTTPRQDLGSEDLTFVDDNSLAFANPITSIPTGLLTVGALILDQDFRVDAQIQAAESTGDGKVISSPRIVTLDNKEASIEQGFSIPFQTFEGGDAKLEFIDAVLSLTVTPHITADESIIMQIEVTRDAPDDSIQTPTGSPAIAKNAAETETLVKDGQTLVLGGIYTIVKSTRQSRIPYLHRIPVIGNAFKSNEVSDSRKELLVFVTPRIVRTPEIARN
jgi:type IV pilus secretin PilQ/predicted competence protein